MAAEEVESPAVDLKVQGSNSSGSLISVALFAPPIFFWDGPTPASFYFVFVFWYRKLVISRIRTRIIGVEGDDADF